MTRKPTAAKKKAIPSDGKYDRVSTGQNGMVQSYCRTCGLIVAASSHLEILEMVETMHTCPVYQNYAAGDGRRPSRR